MKFKSITKIHQGKFITRYDILYETESGNLKNYEMISRNPDLKDLDSLHEPKVDAVVMIMHDKQNEHILLSKEFRLATGEWGYNLPAGLIDSGESATVSAERELREETGLHLDSIEEEWKESYSAVGFSNEKNIVVVGTASGEFKPSNSDVEEIEANWFSKEQVRDLLKNNRFAARTQAYCVLWSKR